MAQQRQDRRGGSSGRYGLCNRLSVLYFPFSETTPRLKWLITVTTAGKHRNVPHALAASVKRYKTSEMLRFIFATIAYDPDPDLTPLTVRRLCKALFGRTGSQWLVVEVFGGEGASAPQRGQQSGDGGKNGCQISSCRRTTLVRNAGRN